MMGSWSNLERVHERKCALFMYVRRSPRRLCAGDVFVMSRRKFCAEISKAAAAVLSSGKCFASENLKSIQDTFDFGENKENAEYLTTQILTYLGNKRSLLKYIGNGIDIARKNLGKEKLSFFDAFSGSGIVARYMKQFASLVIANDLERYSEVVNKCYLTNRTSIDQDKLAGIYDKWVRETHRNLEPGIISKLYAPKDDLNIQAGERVFYTRSNAIILDSARAALDRVCPKEYYNLLLAPLLSEASIHSNTSGVFKGFYKNRDGIGAFGGEGKNALVRICGDVKLQMPVLSNFNCESIVLRGDTNQIVKDVPEVDVAYFDPPYNQHPYGSNYFMLNVLADNREPENISRVSGIPEDWNHSKYNVRSSAEDSFFTLLSDVRAKYLLVSYNSEGFISYDSFIKFLSKLGEVTPVEIEYNTFRGSRNLRARALKVKEYLFMVHKHV